jgi:hypothetical protein
MASMQRAAAGLSPGGGRPDARGRVPRAAARATAPLAVPSPPACLDSPTPPPQVEATEALLPRDHPAAASRELLAACAEQRQALARAQDAFEQSVLGMQWAPRRLPPGCWLAAAGCRSPLARALRGACWGRGSAPAGA